MHNKKEEQSRFISRNSAMLGLQFFYIVTVFCTSLLFGYKCQQLNAAWPQNVLIMKKRDYSSDVTRRLAITERLLKLTTSLARILLIALFSATFFLSMFLFLFFCSVSAHALSLVMHFN